MEHFFRQIGNQRTKEKLNALQMEMVVEKQDKEEEEEEVKHCFEGEKRILWNFIKWRNMVVLQAGLTTSRRCCQQSKAPEF